MMPGNTQLGSISPISHSATSIAGMGIIPLRTAGPADCFDSCVYGEWNRRLGDTAQRGNAHDAAAPTLRGNS